MPCSRQEPLPLCPALHCVNLLTLYHMNTLLFSINMDIYLCFDKCEKQQKANSIIYGNIEIKVLVKSTVPDTYNVVLGRGHCTAKYWQKMEVKTLRNTGKQFWAEHGEILAVCAVIGR